MLQTGENWIENLLNQIENEESLSKNNDCAHEESNLWGLISPSLSDNEKTEIVVDFLEYVKFSGTKNIFTVVKYLIDETGLELCKSNKSDTKGNIKSLKGFKFKDTAMTSEEEKKWKKLQEEKQRRKQKINELLSRLSGGPYDPYL